MPEYGWVRWKEFAGWKPWRKVVGYDFRGPWFIVYFADGTAAATPDHIVRGQIEFRDTDPGATE